MARKPIILPQAARAAIPRPARLLLQRLLCAAADGADLLMGRRTDLTPPSRLRVRVGCFFSFLDVTNYRAVGQEFLTYLKDLAMLQPHHRVLDVGCGCGQVAGPLTGYLDGRGCYEGIDVDPEAIAWCREHISSREPRFTFRLSEVANVYYNPGGARSAREYTFPYPDDSFDCVLVKSVFTHMLPSGVARYVSEIARVLRPNGHCLATFYLLNEEAWADIRAGKSAYDFRHVLDGCRTVDPRTPEHTVGYDETAVRACFDRSGLPIASPIRYGSWCGRDRALSFQDAVIARKGRRSD